MKKLQSRIVSFIVAGLFSALCGHAEDFMPVMHTFVAQDYNGDMQNWSISEGNNGQIYIGNGNCLLAYDGYTWQQLPLPNMGVVRSVLAVGDTIYVGGYKDFGCLVSDKRGYKQYHSLWPTDFKDAHEDEIWNIVSGRDGRVYFQSFNAWYDYDGKKVTPHYDGKHYPLYVFEAGGEVYMQLIRGDFCRLRNGKLETMFTREQLHNDCAVSLLDGGNGHLFLVMQWQGILYYDGNSLRQLTTEVDGALRTMNVNRAAMLTGDSLLAIGTILGGVYCIDSQGKLKWHYDMGNGLPSNTVLGLRSDSNGNLWAALDVGVALVHTASPYYILRPPLSRPSIGMVYAIGWGPSGMYMGTNQAAWLFNGQSINQVTGSWGQNWHITRMGSQLFLGNNDGAMELEGTHATLKGPHQSSTCIRLYNNGLKEVLIESTYSPWRVFTKAGSKWEYSHDVDGFAAPIQQFEIDPSGAIWATHMRYGMYRLRLNEEMTRVTECDYFLTMGEDTTHTLINVFKINGRVMFGKGHRVYTYNDLENKIVPVEAFDSLFAGNICSVTMVNDTLLWASSSRGWMLLCYDGKSCREVSHLAPSALGESGNNYCPKAELHDGYAYFNLYNSVARVDMNRLVTRKKPQSKLQIVSAVTVDNGGQTSEMNLNACEPGIEAHCRGNMHLVLSYPNFNFEPYVFKFHLTGSGKERYIESNRPEIDLTNLKYGSYQLQAAVHDVHGEELAQLTYYFVNDRPFYLRWPAIMSYLIALGLAIYMLVKYRTRKTEEAMRKQFADQKLQQDFKMLEQENIIAAQRQQLLEAQLNDKTREAASLALDAAARNQAIESLRNTLREKRRKGTITQAEMTSMMTQLGENANSEDFWEVYQNNFNLVHENFFKRLKQQYPKLTTSDLRFCALLRLNLSTKDIARFTGLTVRGVEGARYRLRKKLAIPEGKSLTDFFLEFE